MAEQHCALELVRGASGDTTGDLEADRTAIPCPTRVTPVTAVDPPTRDGHVSHHPAAGRHPRTDLY